MQLEPRAPFGQLWAKVGESKEGQLWEHLHGFVVMSAVIEEPTPKYSLLMQHEGRRCTDRVAQHITREFGIEGAKEENTEGIFGRSRLFTMEAQAHH